MDNGKLARNNIYHGDCLELMHGIPDGSIDMILADLPYGTTACHWDSIIPLEPLWTHYKRIIKPRGAIVLTGTQPFTSVLVMSNLEWFKYCWVYEKTLATDYLNGNNKPMRAHEDILVFSDGVTANGSANKMVYNPQIDFSVPAWSKVQRTDPRTGFVERGNRTPFDTDVRRGRDGRLPRSVIRFSNGNSKTIHPTQKPVALFAYLIRTYTNPGELVLDNTAGSGTTAIAAIDTVRDWICMEKDAGYFQIAQERIRERLAQLPLPMAVEPARERVEQATLLGALAL